MKKSQLGPIFFSDIELGQKFGISRISMFRFRTSKTTYSKRSYLIYTAVALIMDNRQALSSKYRDAQPIILNVASALKRWNGEPKNQTIAEALKDSDIDKSTRNYLVNSLAAMLIASDREMFAAMKFSGDQIESGRSAVESLAELYEKWHEKQMAIPETVKDILASALLDIPDLQPFLIGLDANTTERLIFLSLWEYYNNGEETDEESFN